MGLCWPSERTKREVLGGLRETSPGFGTFRVNHFLPWQQACFAVSWTRTYSDNSYIPFQAIFWLGTSTMMSGRCYFWMIREWAQLIIYYKFCILSSTPGWHNWLARETFKWLEISRFRVQASGWANFFLSFSRYIPRCLPHSSSRSFFSCIPAHLAGAIFCSCSIPVAIDVIGQTCWFWPRASTWEYNQKYISRQSRRTRSRIFSSHAYSTFCLPTSLHQDS